MKYIITTLCIIMMLLTMSPVYAIGIGAGVKGGLNFANMYGDDASLHSMKTSFCAGAFVSFGINKLIVIQPEFLYTQKGAKYLPPAAPPDDIRHTIKLDYLEVPILVKVMIPSQSKTKFNLFTGPYIAYNLIAKMRTETHGNVEEVNLDDIKNTDLGVVFGMSLDFPLPVGKIVFDGRYVLGLSQVGQEGTDYKTNVIAFMLGYSFE